jgi:hypothetical protein
VPSAGSLRGATRADILQTARWQAELFERAFQHDQASARLAEAARTFVDAYGARRAAEDEYTAMLRAGLQSFQSLTRVGEPADFQRLLTGLEEAVAGRNVAATQGAHRRLLAHLQSVANV